MKKLIKISYIVLLFALPIQSSDKETSSSYSSSISSSKRVRPQEDLNDMIDVDKLAKIIRPNAAFNCYSNEKLNKIWHHQSVLALTPEMISIKALWPSPDEIGATSSINNINDRVNILPNENDNVVFSDDTSDFFDQFISEQNIEDSANNKLTAIDKNKLTPEQLAYCKEIKAQVLAETHDPEEALKAYKKAHAKIYYSLDTVKNHKRSYNKAKKNNPQELNPLQENNSNSIQSNSTTSDTLSSYDDSVDYNYHNFFDKFIDEENIIALDNENEYSSEQLQDQDSINFDNNEQQKYNFYNLSKASFNEIWDNPSVLALTPEQIWKKPLGISFDSVAITSEVKDTY